MATYTRLDTLSSPATSWILLDATISSVTAGEVVLINTDGTLTVLAGSGFAGTSGPTGTLTTGTITGLSRTDAARLVTYETITGSNYLATQISTRLAEANVEGIVRDVLALADSLNGSAADDVFRAYTGNDTINGGGGIDTMQYFGTFHNGAMTISLSDVSTATNNTANANNEGTDTLVSVEHIIASNNNDTFTATAGFNGSQGTFNIFEGRGGNDTISGNGNTRISFSGATAGVTVNLVAGSATGADVGTDTFSGVNSVFGSQLADTITGDANPNVLIGQGGNDIVSAGGGGDRVVYSGPRASYTISYDGSSQVFTVADNRAGSPDGTDTVSGLTGGTFQFSNQIVSSASLIPGQNLAPVLGTLPTLSVVEDTATSATGTFMATDPNGDSPLFWSLVGATSSEGADFSFGLDAFVVNRNGVQYFADGFGDNLAPPLIPANGAAPGYTVTGTITEVGGRAVLASTGAVPLLGIGTPDPFVGVGATLGTDVNPGNLVDGLKSDDSFTVIGRFDLAQLPNSPREAVGIRLSDRLQGGPGTPPDQAGDDLVELDVFMQTDGVVRVLLIDRDAVADTFTVLDRRLLTPPAGADQITLRLIHDATQPGVVRAAFDFLAGGTVVQTVGMTATGSIFNGENWTRAVFFAFAPQTSDSIETGVYGTLAVDQVGKTTYTLANGQANVQALAGGQAVTDTFQLRVSDGSVVGTTTQSVVVSVTGSNDPPTVAAPIADQAFAAGATFSFTVPANTFGDVDVGDSRTLSALMGGTPLPSWLTFDAASGTFSGTPGIPDVGIYAFTVTATDSAGAQVSDEFFLTVNNSVPVNQPPTADADGPYAATEDTALVVTAANGVLAGDNDPDAGDTLTAALVSGTSNGALTLNADGSFSYAPTANFNGADSFVYRAIDSGGLASQNVTVQINVAAVNDAPVVAAPIGTQTATQGQLFTFTIPANAFFDADGDALGYSINEPASWLRFNSETGTFSGTPGLADVGDQTIRLEARDDSDSVVTFFDIVVQPGANQPPVAPVGTLAAIEDTAITFDARQFVTDPDGDPLTITAVEVLQGGQAVLNPDGTITYTPVADASGLDILRYTVSDGRGGIIRGLVDIEVAPVNDRPIASAQTLTAVEDAVVNGTLQSTDVDGGAPNYALVAGSAVGGAITSFNATTGAFTFTPEANFNGPASFRFTVSDGSLASSEQTVTIDVAPANDPAVITGQLTGTVDEDAVPGTVTGTLTATDIDSAATFNVAANALTATGYGRYSITAAGVWNYALENANPTVDALNDGGTLTDTFTVSTIDGTQQVVTVTITGTTDAAPNTAPVITYNNGNPASVSSAENTTLVAAITATDPEVTAGTQSLDYTLSGEDAALFEVRNGNEVHFSTAPNFEAQPVSGPTPGYQVTVEVTDGTASDTQAITLAVTNIDEAPVVSRPVQGSATEDGAPVALNGLGNSSDPDAGSQLTLVGLPSVLPAGVGIQSAGPVNLSDFAGISIPVGSNDAFSRPVAANVYSVTAPPYPINTSLGIGYMVNPGPIDAFLGDQAFVFHDHQYVGANIPDPARGVITFQFATPTVIDTLDVIEHFNGITKLHAYVGNSLTSMTDIGSVFGSLGDITGSAVMFNGQHNLFDFNNTIAGTYLQVVIEKTSFAGGYAFFRMYPEAISGTFVLDPSHVAFQSLAAGQQTVVSFDYGISDGTSVTPTSVSWTVTGTNDAPTVANAIADQTATEGAAFAVPAGTFADVDTGDSRTLTASGNPAWLTFDAASGAFSGTPGFADAGTYTITVTATDGSNASVSDTFTLTVGEGIPVNTSPTADADGPYATNEDTALVVSAAAGVLAGDTDPEGNALTAELVSFSANGDLLLNADGSFSYTPNANFNGVHTFVYRAVDDGGLPSQNVTVTIDVASLNDEQTAPATNSVALTEDTASTPTAIAATDIDGDALTYAIKSGTAPTKGTVAFDAAAGTFVYTPTANANGADTFTILIDDGQGVVSEQIVSVAIAPVSDAAVIAGVRTGSVTEDGTLIASGTLTVSDPDAGEAAFRTPARLVGAYGTFTFDATTGQWDYALNNAAANVQALTAADTRTETLTVTSLDGAASQSIDVTVRGADDGIVGQPGQTTVNGTGGSDAITIGGTNLAVNAGAGNDSIAITPATGTQFHFVDGGAGNDTLDLAATTTAVNVNLGSGLVIGGQVGFSFVTSIENATGGSAADTLTGNGGANRLDGGSGNDTISGGGGADTIIGGAGSDSLDGGGGADRIEGGIGNDILIGGGQSDTFVFRPGFGTDRITDFDANPAGGQDFIELAGFGITAANFASRVSIADGGQFTLLRIDNDPLQTIRLDGIGNPSVVTADDFRFF